MLLGSRKLAEAARISRRSTFTAVALRKKKDARYKSAVQVLEKRVEHNESLKILLRAPAGITFRLIANEDIDNLKNEQQKIIAKKVSRTCINVAGEGDYGPSTRNCHQIVE